MLKASALICIFNPRQWVSFLFFWGGGLVMVMAMDSCRGRVSGFRLVLPFGVGLAGGSHSTESLILAQDERWRRA